VLFRINRLSKKKDFETVFKTGKTAKANFLCIKFKENKFPYSRFGFIVSKKVTKKASGRNLIKRRLRNCLRLKISKIKEGFDAIIIAKPVIFGKKYREIETEIDSLLKSAGLLK